jgi:hypothetical protein
MTSKKAPKPRPKAKTPGQRGGHKPSLPPEMTLVTRGMRARPDEWARFHAIVELNADGTKQTRGASERTIFAQMIRREADALDPALAEKFERIRRKKLSDIVASNAKRAAKR